MTHIKDLQTQGGSRAQLICIDCQGAMFGMVVNYKCMTTYGGTQGIKNAHVPQCSATLERPGKKTEKKANAKAECAKHSTYTTYLL